MKQVKKSDGPKEVLSETIQLENNDQALIVFGPGEPHLKLLQESIPVRLASRGNELTIEGVSDQVKLAIRCVRYLQDISRVRAVELGDVNDCLRALVENQSVDLRTVLQSSPIITSKKKLYPRTISQKRYVEAIEKNDIVFGVGPAGTGKTYLAMAVAISKLLKGEVDRIILTRPAVEAGEKLGFLPGDLAEKVNPYLRPLLDALHEMIDYERAERMMAAGQIEIAPIAFMRGRTLNDSYVILDEAQNCTREQMKMFLTRLGENSRAVITGDVTQIDLPRETKSGLIQAIKILGPIDGIAIHQFDAKDVVRHKLVMSIIKAYDKASRIP